MSDLTPAVWKDIDAATMWVNLAMRAEVPVIEIARLRAIIRKARRTTTQNALLWALYDDVLEKGGEALGGWTREDLHTFLLGEHFGWEVSEAFGCKRQRPIRRSSRLTKTEFGKYVDFVVQRMAEHGIVLSLPGDVN